MDIITLRYRRPVDPSRGLAATGVFFIKVLLALPHLLVVGVLSNLANLLAYLGFWVVAFTGSMPQATHRVLELSFNWSTRAWTWLLGFEDAYPPFETDPEWPVSVPVSAPTDPSTGWAVAGIFVFPKAIMLIPHFLVLVVLIPVGFIAAWVAFVITALTGAYPPGLQDFQAGLIQWALRVQAWFVGLTDVYPPFRLDARPVD